MAAPKKPAGKDSGGKAKGGKKSRNLYKLYDISSGKIVRKNPFSPKSPGDFMAVHKDRVVCGKTGYTEKRIKKE